MADLAKLFQAIADEKRQKILMLLDERERCVGELVGSFQLSQPAVSRHLLILKNAGLVSDRRSGQQVIYSLNKENLKNCCREYFVRFDCCNSLFSRNHSNVGESN